MDNRYQLRITFKNVNQGDCIFIEWRNDQGEMELGIIDCNRTLDSNNNRIYDHLACYKYISFILISHPHTDHYLGVNELLDYCERKNIRIQQIIHTAVFNSQNLRVLSTKWKRTFLNSFVNDSLKNRSPRSELLTLLKRIHAFHKNRSVETKEVVVTGDQLINIDSPNLEFRLLSPSYPDEHADYASSVFDDKSSGVIVSSNNPNANLLSSVLRIKSEKWQVLLTSDVRKKSLQRILDDNLDELVDEKCPLVVAQVPHHGSGNEQETHSPKFWNKLLRKNITSAFISSGISIHEHPREEIVKYFSERTQGVFATNYVYGYKTYHEEKPTDNEGIMSALDWVSGGQYEISDRGNRCGEQQVSIKFNGRHDVATL